MNIQEINQSVFKNVFHSIYGDYKIIKDLGIIDNRRIVRIKFLTTGFEKDVRYDNAINEKGIRDPYYPKIYGVACSGNVTNIRTINKRAYDRWIKMIGRCYNQNDKDYKNYGAIGVTVDPRWHCFENYLNDLPNLPIIGTPNPDFDLLDYQVDKDYLQMNIPKNQRIYSKDTCVLVNPRDNANLKLIDNSKNKVNNYFGVYRSYNRYYPTIMHDGIVYKLGVYTNEIAAANAYNYYYNSFNHHNYSVNTINDVPYMPYEEFSKYNIGKRKLPVCPVSRIK